MMLATACTIPLAFLTQVDLDGDILRLGDIADLSPLPRDLARRVGRTALLRIDRDARQTTVPSRELAAQVQARVPLLASCFPTTGDPVVIRRHIAETAPRVMATAPVGITKGEKVGIRIVSGPFAIERNGIAAGDAKPGDRLFVRTGDGQVVRAVVEGAVP